MTQSAHDTQQNIDVEKGPAHSTTVESPRVNFMVILTSEEVITTVSKKLPKDGYTQNLLAAGGLSASLASQLLPAITTASSTIGYIAHTVLSVTCIMGLATFIIHAIPQCESSVETSSVLAYSSLCFTTVAIVVLAWAIQPEPVAITVTVVFAMVVLAMIVRSVYFSARIPNPEHNVVR